MPSQERDIRFIKRRLQINTDLTKKQASSAKLRLKLKQSEIIEHCIGN